MTPTENVDTSHPSVAFGAKIITARIPALYASKLLSAAFWSDPTIPMKSENHFHFNALMITEATFRGDVLNQHFDPCSPAGELPARLQPGELEMMRGWNEQLQNWLTLRDGWYKPSQAQWQDSSVRFCHHKHLKSTPEVREPPLNEAILLTSRETSLAVVILQKQGLHPCVWQCLCSEG